jgi:hypothetical protein
MVVELQGQEAVLPLRALAREFGVDPASSDGVMLGLIEQALDFVVVLRFGDELPSEVEGGEPSWKPTELDRKVASSRVLHGLVRCVFIAKEQTVPNIGPRAPGWEDAAGNRALLRQAIAGAVTQLRVKNEGEVTERVEAVSEEVAYIETMRRALSSGMAGPEEKLLRIPISQLPPHRREMMLHVQALARRGMKGVTNRLVEVDGRVDDTLTMLRDTKAAIDWLRSQRNWLFRTKRAWDPVFADWMGASPTVDEFLWKVVERTYAFLAPRFMSFQEWAVVDAQPKQQKLRGKVW